VERKLVYQGSGYFKPRNTNLVSQHAQEIYECVKCGKLTYDVPTDDDAPQWPVPDGSLSLAIDELPHEVALVWSETLSCRRADAPLATAAMLRTLIIAIWRDQNKEEKKMPRFEAALDDLEKSQALTKPLRDRADKLRVLGNYVVHEIKPPDERELEAALQIAHLWLRVIYLDVPPDE
jgi:hypothetical protein